MLLDRIYPRPGQVEAADAVSGLDLGSRAPEGRPYVALNMVATLDGKAAVSGSTRGMGGEADRELFHSLRTQADAILVGAGTVRDERYGKAIKTDALRARREQEGLAPEPITVVVSFRGELPPDLPILQEPGAAVIVATAAEGEIEGVVADVTYERTGDDLPLLLARLRDEHGIRSILCEGGPTLNSHLMAAGLADELFLSIDPVIVGGADALTLVAGRPLAVPARAELVTLLRSDEGLFGRWRLRG
ncbi:MAG: RibD family protein [Thermoleophilaceae bacterium]